MKIGHKTDWYIWCNKCSDKYEMEIILITKNKKGKYYPYRDTMEAEIYYYTELKVRCPHCKTEIQERTEKHYTMSETDMQKYGYRGANYGS